MEKNLTEVFYERAAKLNSAFDRLIGFFASGRFWFLKAGLMSVALALISNLPYYEAWDEIPDWWVNKAIAFQVEHPFTPIDIDFFVDEFARESPEQIEGPKSHLDKRGLRITIPVIGHLLNLGPWTWPVLNHLSGAVFFCLFPICLKLLRQYCENISSTGMVPVTLTKRLMQVNCFND